MRRYIYHIIILIYLYISYFPQVASAATQIQRSGKTEIYANIIAIAHFRVYGYTAPYSQVHVESVRVFGKTVSDIDGYFEFEKLPVSEEAKEVCLITIDGEKRTGFPVCVVIPERNSTDEIGPIILSPTLSVSNNLLWEGDQARASGRTIPGATVIVSYFESPADSLSVFFDRIMAQVLPRVALAKQVPLLTVPSDRKGNFSVNLPSSKVAFYRIFSKAIYNKESPSPKSTTLTFLVGSFWSFWIRFILPKLLLLLIALIITGFATYYEAKNRKVRAWLYHVNETRLAPFGVKIRLKLRRIWYNYQDYQRSSRK